MTWHTVSNNQNSSHPTFRDIIDDARIRLHRDWDVQNFHVAREHNVIAHKLAKHAHRLNSNFCMFHQPSSFITEVDVVRTWETGSGFYLDLL